MTFKYNGLLTETGLNSNWYDTQWKILTETYGQAQSQTQSDTQTQSEIQSETEIQNKCETETISNSNCNL